LLFQIVMSQEVENWMDGLPSKLLERFIASLKLLEEHGPNLGRPLVDQIKGSSIRNLKELRMGHYRILFTFSNSRQALMLVAGNKEGRWDSWYQGAIARAELTLEREF
jgi:hypothetical protein